MERSFEGNNLVSLLADAAGRKPEGVFYFYRGVPVTYRESLGEVERLAGFLRKRGVGRGDRVLLDLGNTPGFITSLFAAFHAGAAAVLVNPAARRFELGHYIGESRPRFAFTSSAQIPHFRDEQGRFFMERERIILTDGAPGFPAFREAMGEGTPGSPPEVLEPVAPAVIIFTSAMEGDALGAMITHRSIRETAAVSARLLDLGDDVFITPLPLFHSFGLTTTLFIPLYGGVPLHLTDRFSPRPVLDLLAGKGITIFTGVPVIYKILGAVLPPGTAFPRMKAWISGGEAISAALQEDLKKRFGMDVRQGYGLTEASPIVTWNLFPRENVFGSVGRPLPWNEARIITGDREAGPGEEGEIIVKGVNIFSGYLNRAEKTREAIPDGWLHTGDLATSDADGNYFITGRKKDMIIKNGFNVYPREVEKILRLHPSVDDVRLTGHIEKRGDLSWHESLDAVIYKKKNHILDREGLLAWFRGNLSSYKIPDTINING